MFKKSVSLVLVVLMVFSFAMVNAAEDSSRISKYSKIPTTGTPSKTPGYASGGGTYYTKSSGLITGNAYEIYEYSDRYLRMYANTESGILCDEIGYEMYLEKWDSFTSTWVPQSPYYPKTEYDDNYVWGYYYKSVSPGFYRVNVIHFAEEGDDYESFDEDSDYIYVD